MSPHEKKGNKRMLTPKQKLIHNPIPIHLSFFLIHTMYLLCVDKDTEHKIN